MSKVHHFNVSNEVTNGLHVAPVRSLDLRIRMKEALVTELVRQADNETTGSEITCVEAEVDRDDLVLDGVFLLGELVEAVVKAIPEREE